MIRTVLHSKSKSKRWALVALLPVLFSGCVIQHSYLRPGYAEHDAAVLKRIVVVMSESKQPLDRGLGKLLPVVAREYLSVQKDYIVFPTAIDQTGQTASICKGNPKLNGVLFLSVRHVERSERSVTLGLGGELHTCEEPRVVVWRVHAKDTQSSDDPDLKTVAESYSNRLGAEVKPYAVPVYLTLRRLLEELPNPTLTEDEKLEKIELME